MKLSFGIILAYGLLIGGGPTSNELLDYLDTTTYWKSRGVTVSAESLITRITIANKPQDIGPLIEELGSTDFQTRERATAEIEKYGPSIVPQLEEALKSDDAEVVGRVRQLIKRLSNDLDKLMAIRALGELRAESAIPALEKLTKSDELFVSDYARRSLAMISGKSMDPRGLSRQDWERDLWMLPKECNLVGQVHVSGIGPFPIHKVFDEASKLVPPQQLPGQDLADQKELVVRQLNQQVLMALEKVGNIRFDGATFGVMGSPENGNAMLIWRGQFDRERIRKVLLNEVGASSEDRDGVYVAQPHPNISLLMPSNDLLVVLGSAQANKTSVTETLAVLKAGKGELHQNAAMVKLIDSIPDDSMSWTVAQVTDFYREIEWLAPFDTLTTSRTMQDGMTHFKLQCQGRDADAVQDVVDQVNAEIESMRKQFKQMEEMMPKPIVEAFNSLELDANAGKAVLTMSMKADHAAMLGLGLGFIGLRAPVN